MTPLWILLIGAVGTSTLRLLFINLIPAHRLPPRLRSSLQLIGPAALAALVATDIGNAAMHPLTIWPTTAAVLTAGIIAVCTKNLALTILGGLAASVLTGLQI